MSRFFEIENSELRVENGCVCIRRLIIFSLHFLSSISEMELENKNGASAKRHTYIP